MKTKYRKHGRVLFFLFNLLLELIFNVDLALEYVTNVSRLQELTGTFLMF